MKLNNLNYLRSDLQNHIHLQNLGENSKIKRPLRAESQFLALAAQSYNYGTKSVCIVTSRNSQ